LHSPSPSFRSFCVPRLLVRATALHCTNTRGQATTLRTRESSPPRSFLPTATTRPTLVKTDLGTGCLLTLTLTLSQPSTTGCQSLSTDRVTEIRSRELRMSLMACATPSSLEKVILS